MKEFPTALPLGEDSGRVKKTAARFAMEELGLLDLLLPVVVKPSLVSKLTALKGEVSRIADALGSANEAEQFFLFSELMTTSLTTKRISVEFMVAGLDEMKKGIAP